MVHGKAHSTLERYIKKIKLVGPRSMGKQDKLHPKKYFFSQITEGNVKNDKQISPTMKGL
jgi:hypothetical protein